MDWAQVLTIVGANIALLLGLLGTTISLHNQTTSLHMQSNNQIAAIHQEMKDFHGRLCAIEERNKTGGK